MDISRYPRGMQVPTIMTVYDLDPSWKELLCGEAPCVLLVSSDVRLGSVQ